MQTGFYLFARECEILELTFTAYMNYMSPFDKASFLAERLICSRGLDKLETACTLKVALYA